MDDAENIYEYRDFVCGFGQSNMGTYGDPLNVWPQTQRYDESSGLASIFMYGDGHVAGGWGNWGLARASSGVLALRGMLMNSVAARMRGLGLRPSIAVQWHGGATAQECFNDMATVAPWFKQRYHELVSPRSATCVWSQGESEAALGTAADWLNWTQQSIAYLRNAMEMPDLHVILVQLAETYNPSMALPFLHDVRNAQQTLVLSDPNTSICSVKHVTTVTSGIHLGQYDLDRQAAIIAANIRSRIAAL